MEDYKEKLTKAHTELIETYLEQLKETYLELPIKRRTALLQGLEKLLDREKDVNLKRAREIREQEGLSQGGLAKEIGVSQRSISGYENDGIKRSTKNTQKYIDWLKERGYEEE